MTQVEQQGTPAAGAFSVRLIVLGVLAPALLLGIAVGIALPLIPVSATRLGADLATAGLVAAMLPIGKIVSDVPAGALAARIGDRAAMVLAAGISVVAFAGAALAPSLWVLGTGVFLLGVATGVFHLARHAYVARVAPPNVRGRVLSTLGGMHRLGYFVGPFLGAAVILGGSLAPAYWVGGGFSAAALAVLLAVRTPDGDRETAARQPGGAKPLGVWRVLVRHRDLFATLGVTTVLIGAVRGARQTVIPLWGAYLGLDAEVISLVFGISGALDIVLFYPAGKIMDRFGRLWVGIPSMLFMGAAMAALPFTGSVVGLAVVAGLLGLGNGLGSGLVMTIGADVAPPDARAAFLGVWRLFQDTGEGVGPLLVAGGAALGSLAVGIWAASTMGLFSSAAMARFVPRYTSYGTRMT